MLYHRGQIAMRGRDQADVNLVRTVAAEPLEFLLLQDAQQFRLKFQRNVADLVKKERAFVGEFEPSRFLGDGAGERSFFVAEQLALEESKRDCGAIQFDESRSRCDCSACESRAQSSSLPVPVSPRISTLESVGATTDTRLNAVFNAGLSPTICPKLGANFLLEIESLFRFFISILCRLFVLQRVLNCNRYLTGHLLEQDDVVFLEKHCPNACRASERQPRDLGLRAEDNTPS